MHPTAASPLPRPVTAVLAIVIREGRVLLVRRANRPDAGLWGFPGGKVDFGETLLAAAERELLEETGVRAVATRVLTAADAWDYNDDGALLQHFVLVAVLCRWQDGDPVAADDALEAEWVALLDMDSRAGLSRDVAMVARQAAALV